MVYRFDLGQNNDGCAPEVALYLRDLVTGDGFRRLIKDYPTCGAPGLRQKIALRHGVGDEDVLVTSGIEQGISLIARALLGPEDFFAVPVPSFYIFNNFSTRTGATGIELPLAEDHQFCWRNETLQLFERVLTNQSVKLLWLANPNNPTGKYMSQEQVRDVVELARRHGCTVVVDEAYGEYTDTRDSFRSASALLPAFSNLIVLRTFSKAYGLAGMRVGYLLTADPLLHQRLERHSENYPVSSLSVAAATTALDHPEYVERTRQRTRQRIDRLIPRLNALPDIVAFSTDCCIFTVRHRCLTSLELTAALEKMNIITSPVPGNGVAGQYHVRITTSVDSQNEALFKALAKIAEKPQPLCVSNGNEETGA